MSETDPAPAAPRPPRRKRYSGKNPRQFTDKYKELRGDAQTLEKVSASGKTPAGRHRPIMVAEILDILSPRAGETMLDATLGWGGHAECVAAALRPGGQLIGVDQDPVQLPRTEARLRAAGFSEEVLIIRRSNFAGAPKVLAELGIEGVDGLLADLGVSSMQIDDPARGFSFKHDGPVDMRMNPEKGRSAADLLVSLSPEKLSAILTENADEPQAIAISAALAGQRFSSTVKLAAAIRTVPGLPRDPEKVEDTVRRVFQALRIAVNEEFTALDTLLRNLPGLLNPGGRAAILTFHSGEDRRVKQALRRGLDAGEYSLIADDVIRPGRDEILANPRSSPAKLRWAVRA